MNSYQTQPAALGHNWWETKETQNDQVLWQKFQFYDKNRDGSLEQGEFRSLLKDLFSSQSNQFLDDAIEETVWRVPHADFIAAKQAISNINALRGESQPPSTSKPFNAQGQQVLQNPSTTTAQEFNPFNIPPPLSHTPPPTVDLSSLPPPLIPLRSSGEVHALPPPPIAHSGGVGGLKKAPLSAADMGVRPTPLKAPAQPMPSKPAAKAYAKPPAFIPPTQDMLQERLGPAPVRVLPMSQAKPGLNSAAAASEEESRAFVEYINTSVALQQDPDCKGILPIRHNSADIYTIVSDGWLLCKLLNAIQSEIIPSAQIKIHPKNAFEKIENHSLAIQAAKKLGCKTVNIGPEDLLQGKPRLVLGLLWQIIKRDVLSKVSLAQHPEIYKLARNTNNLKEISESSPEEVLLKWANHHLQKATNGSRQIANFSNDVRDGTTYTLLMNQVAPQVCTTDALRETDIRKRAQMVVDNAKKLNCDRFVTPADIINGNDKLNLAFVADLFNKHSGLELPTLEEMEKLKKQNTSMSKILDEAEARLRQILADGQLAHELQQEEILLYRQRKLKEQEQLAEQEAMLRAQVQQEELMLMQQQRIKELKLAEQESFAREEQRKEEMRVAKRPVSTTYGSTSSSSGPRSSTSSTPSAQANKAAPSSSSYYPAASTSAPRSTPATTSSYPSTASYYPPSSTTTPAPSYSTPSAYPTTAPTSSYPTYSAPTTTPQPYSTTPQSYPPTSTASNPYNVTPAYGAAPPNTYNTAPNPYNAAPNPYNAAPNHYNAGTYPPADYPVAPTSSYTTTQSVYTEPPPIAGCPEPYDSPVVRRKGIFERVGNKIDRAFH